MALPRRTFKEGEGVKTPVRTPVTQRSTGMTSSAKDALLSQQSKMASRPTPTAYSQVKPSAPQTTTQLSSGLGRETGNFSYQQAAKLRNSRMRKRL
jgi:hypothetical protein